MQGNQGSADFALIQDLTHALMYSAGMRSGMSLGRGSLA
jgi:hypothetical protein